MRKSIFFSTLAMAVGAVASFALFSGDGGASPIRVATDTGTRLQVHDLRPPSTEQSELRATKPPPSSGAAVSRLRLGGAGISAATVTGYVDGNNVMIAPSSASAVAWYKYSALPGQGGNAVFSGHVDYVGVGPAVFWGLRSARVGDTVEVDLADGSTLRYRIEFNRVYSAQSGPWDELFAVNAAEDVVTLYTCDGAFSRGEYSDRRVVRATRIL